MINLNYVLVNPTNIAYIRKHHKLLVDRQYYYQIIIGWQGGAELSINYSVLEERDIDYDYLVGYA